MIKFETINGTLCRMVEPEPLAPEAKFPCVVRLIQDDSFEIVGYPVADGSNDWALYQMMQGNSVTDFNTVYWYNGEYVVWKKPDAVGNVVQSPERWLAEKADAGWQIYEPKPKYIAGDWVEYVCDNNGNRTHARVIEMPTKKHCLAHLESFHEDRIRVEENAITRKLKPSEVILDFGNGIKGKVSIYQETSDGIWVGRHVIHMPDIAEPMRTTVLELLKAQSEEA